jgi:radical SAM-linked protein
VTYSEGFSPRPKLHFGLALSTGHESEAEYLDIDLLPTADQPVHVDRLAAQLSPCLPVGIDVQTAAEIEASRDSLQQAVTSSSWLIEASGGEPAQLDEAVERVLAADQLILTRQRKGKDVTDDVRPYIRSLATDGPTPRGVMLRAELGTQPRGLRPSELLAVLADGLVEGLVCRTHQWIEHDGARREPLPIDATSAPRTPVCAS